MIQFSSFQIFRSLFVEIEISNDHEQMKLERIVDNKYRFKDGTQADDLTTGFHLTTRKSLVRYFQK